MCGRSVSLLRLSGQALQAGGGGRAKSHGAGQGEDRWGGHCSVWRGRMLLGAQPDSRSLHKRSLHLHGENFPALNEATEAVRW